MLVLSHIFSQSAESIYESECGNMPGFAVYYRYPNSQRVTFGQFVKVRNSDPLTSIICIKSNDIKFEEGIISLAVEYPCPLLFSVLYYGQPKVEGQFYTFSGSIKG